MSLLIIKSKPNQPTKKSRERSEEARGDDFVSRLLQSTPAKDDELSTVRNKHHRIFQEQFACEDLGGTSLTSQENQSVHQMRTGNPDLENSDMGMQEADELLSLFREQHHYFPFITVSDTTHSQEMAVTSPFLLLAILTVCSTKRPRLHRRTEERFRRALGDNIVVQGEKSLEYVQGLLVYLGWYVCQFDRGRYCFFQGSSPEGTHSIYGPLVFSSCNTFGSLLACAAILN